jgi:hypothetical protein
MTVTPSSEAQMNGVKDKGGKRIPARVAKHLKSNNVNVFLYSRPFRKNKEKSENEFEVIIFSFSLIVLGLMALKQFLCHCRKTSLF